MFQQNQQAFTAQQIQLVDDRIAQVPEEVKEGFETAYKKWLDYCNTPSIRLSSNSADRGAGVAFDTLVQMGTDNPQQIMPLLVRKLMDPAEFMAHTIYGKITGANHWVMLPQNEARNQALGWINANP